MKAYGCGRIQTISVDDEYRKADAAIAANTVVFPFRVGDPGLSGSLEVKNVSVGAIASFLREASGAGVLANAGSDYWDASRELKINMLLSSKSWGFARTLTHNTESFDIDESIEFHRDAIEAESEEFAIHFLFSSSEARNYERFVRQEWASGGSPRVLEDEPKSDWLHEPEGILQRLENKETFPEDYEAAILFAEVKPFRGEQKIRLLDALAKYIRENRFVEDHDSLVTLCSAIRKYAMNMPESRFEEYANWLLPTETATLHHEAEMEFAKGICWRLEFEPHVWPADYPVLTKTLFDLVDSYLTPRLILQKSYANTAMFGMVALHILEAISIASNGLVGHLRKKMLDSGVKWFVEMVDDNLDEAIQYFSERDADLAKKVTKIRQG
jgi:hypothetical protein